MSNARPTPAQNHPLRKDRRARERASPQMRPATKKTIEYLVRSPSPMAAPMAIHQRVLSLVSKRMVNQHTSTHHRYAKVVYWNSVDSKRGSPESATESAA